MPPRPIALLVLLPIVAAGPRCQSPDAAARARVDAALAAMGGAERLAAIHRLRFEQDGHTNLLEQSERPEGPWIVQYEHRVVELDFDNARVRVESKTQPMPTSPGFAQQLLYDGGVAVRSFGPGRDLPDASLALELEALLALSPARALLTAAAAPDLRLDAAVELQGTRQDVVAFGWRDAQVRILLNVHTHLPTAVEWRRADPTSLFFGVWGDVATRESWSFWNLEPGGLHLPLQIDTEKNGQPWRSALAAGHAVDAEMAPVVIADAAKAAFAKAQTRDIQGLPLGGRSTELAPGVVLLQNNWNTTLVEQDDRVVVIEAPYSAGYSEQVIAEAGRRFPGKPVAAVVSCSDAWPHIGGVRGYVAHDVEVYVLDLNRPILERLVQAPFTSRPDALAKNPRPPRWHVVAGRTPIGTGRNAIEVCPLRTETGERMLMVWLPGCRGLYAADLVQPQRDGSFFMPQYLGEVRDAVRREGFAVETVFAMHAPPTPWTTIEAAVDAASGRPGR